MKIALMLLIAFSIPAGRSLAQDFVPGTEITTETILERMNFYRGLHGAPPLRLDSRLNAVAEERMRDMELEGYWSHASPDGRGPFVRMPFHGYRHSAAGENLAAGFETAEVLVSSWMESPGHRRNILSTNFADAGIAIIDGAVGGRAVGKSIVVLFAREAADTASASSKRR